MTMHWFQDFAESPACMYDPEPVRQYGFEIDWFSRVYNRTLLVGTLVYQCRKNFRLREDFEKHVEQNRVEIPGSIVLKEGHLSAMRCFQSYENYMVQRAEQIERCYSEFKMIAEVRSPQPRKNGKAGRYFKILRRKRFFINIENGMVRHLGQEPLFTGRTTIACTFRDSMR